MIIFAGIIITEVSILEILENVNNIYIFLRKIFRH